MKIRVQGLSEGAHALDERADASAIDGIFPEFFGVVRLHGTVQKIKAQFVFRCTVECNANLVCDRSGEDFQETIQTPFAITYIADTERFLLQQKEFDPEPPLYIRADEKFIDLSEEIRQLLALALPMKRIAPQYRDVDFEDILAKSDDMVDETSDDTQSDDNQGYFIADERWAALRDMKFEQSLHKSKRKN